MLLELRDRVVGAGSLLPAGSHLQLRRSDSWMRDKAVPLVVGGTEVAGEYREGREAEARRRSTQNRSCILHVPLHFAFRNLEVSHE